MAIMDIAEVSTVIWALIGFALGMVGLFLFDLSTPAYKIKQELEEKNPAIGIVMAGLLFSTGIIVYNSMIFSDSLIVAIKYGFIGIALNIALYHLVNLMLPSWNLNHAIDNHNQGAAWFVFGLFLLIGQSIGGAIS